MESSANRIGRIPRNLLAVSITSFFTDISSEMIVHLLPLYLANVLGAGTAVIGLIEGVAESTASLTKLFSGWLSDVLGKRKGLTVFGYSISAFCKPLFLLAGSWPIVLLLRFMDRLGKGIRTAPRDALVADSIQPEDRGLAFGLHRASDSGGAAVGVGIAALVTFAAGATALLTANTFYLVVALSIFPAAMGVISLLLVAKDVPPKPKPAPIAGQKLDGIRFSPRLIGFFIVVTLFTLGNSSDSFLVLRAQDRGLSVFQVMLAVFLFNIMYALISMPAGWKSDTVGRGRMILLGWLLYGAVYLGFALANATWQIWILYPLYGLYYALTDGTARAFVADLAPVDQRGTAFGIYNAAIGVVVLPASLIAGVLWQGAFGWTGFGAAAPFYFGAGLALISAVLLAVWVPRLSKE
jgi:MFS family permease